MLKITEINVGIKVYSLKYLLKKLTKM